MMECSFEDAFFWSLRYNGWEMHADAMCEYLRNPANRQSNGTVLFPEGESACVTRDDVIHDRPNSFLWMCLVQMFGDYGTSPRYGWIDHPDEACAWLRSRQRATYHDGKYLLDDGVQVWEESDEDIREDVAWWEREHAEQAMGNLPTQGFGLFEEIVQDDWMRTCEEENHGRLSDSQYAACLRAHARRVKRVMEVLDDVVKSGLKGSNPLGVLSDRRMTG